METIQKTTSKVLGAYEPSLGLQCSASLTFLGVLISFSLIILTSHLYLQVTLQSVLSLIFVPCILANCSKHPHMS